MSQVSVTIDGKAYRMACDPGQEEHLQDLAGRLDQYVKHLKGSFGEIGDMRLHVMAALTIADEVSELRRKTGALEAEVAELKDLVANGDARTHETEERYARAIISASERIERLARSLNTATSAGSQAEG